MKNSNSLELILKELERWPGVTHRAEHVGRHPRIWVRYGDNEKFVTFSTTQVGRYGLMQKVTQLRRLLREIGATRE